MNLVELLDQLEGDWLMCEPNTQKDMRRPRDVRDEMATFFDDEAWHGAGVSLGA
jgi:hypothetical protein